MVQVIGGTLCFLDKLNSTMLAQSKSLPVSHGDRLGTSLGIPECNSSRSDLSRLADRGGLSKGISAPAALEHSAAQWGRLSAGSRGPRERHTRHSLRFRKHGLV